MLLSLILLPQQTVKCEDVDPFQPSGGTKDFFITGLQKRQGGGTNVRRKINEETKIDPFKYYMLKPQEKKSSASSKHLDQLT